MSRPSTPTRDPRPGGTSAGSGASETFARRVQQTFVAPARLVRSIQDTAPWIDVLLLSTAIAAISVLGMPDDVFLDPMREAVSRRGQPVQIISSPEDIVRWGRAIAMLATIATHPILVFTLAGVLTLVFTVFGHGSTGYREYLSLAAHGMLIPAFGSALVLLVRLTASQWGLGAAPVRAAPDGSFLLASLSAVDPFTLWMMVVLAVGAHGLDRRHTVLRASALLVAGYLFVVIITTALLFPDLS